MKVKPWMYGVGVLGVAGVGIVLYEVFKSKTPAAGGTTTATRPPTLSATPTLTALRPAIVNGAGSFGVYPTGPVLVLTDSGSLSASPTTGQNLTLVLPRGGSWEAVVAGNSSNPDVALGQVALFGDNASPISLPVSQLPAGINMLIAAWFDASNVKHYTTVSLPTVVAPHALTLRI